MYNPHRWGMYEQDEDNPSDDRFNEPPWVSIVYTIVGSLFWVGIAFLIFYWLFLK